MVTLSWDTNSEPDLAGYILHYGTSSRDYLDGVDVGNTTGCTISGLEPGQEYYFAVTAYNTFGESGFSEEVAYTIPDTPPPPPPLQYVLSVATVGNGSVQLDPPGGTYDEGAVVRLTAVTGPAAAFDSWSGGITGSVNPATITMNADKNVTAKFTELSYISSETFNNYTAGSDPVDWLDTAAKNSMAESDSLFEVYDIGGEKVYGTDSTQANIHSHYVGGGSESLSGYEYTGRMMITNPKGGIGVTFFSQYPNEDAYYRLRRYDSNAFHIAPHGTKVTGDTDTGVVPESNVWYRFKIQVEDTGSQTEIRAKVWQQGKVEPANWQANAIDTSSSRLIAGTFGLWSYYTGNKYWDDLTVTPLGTPPLRCELTIDTLGDGSVQLNPPGGIYDEGTVVQLTASAAAGWEFSDWSGDFSGSGNPATITMVADGYVKATFTEKEEPPPLQYELAVETLGNGSVVLDPSDGIYDEGTVVKLTASAAAGWEFSDWSGHFSGSGNPATITMVADGYVKATFTEKEEPPPLQYELAVVTLGNGSVVLDPSDGTYDEGTNVQLTASAAAGWEFAGWNGDLSGSANPVTITMDADKNVTATFTELSYIYSETFNAYTAGSDPVDWLDTAAKNSMAENDSLFEVYDIGGEKVYGTDSTQANIHSHYVGGGSESLSGYEYTGRMMITNPKGGIGVTFFSQYPNEDAYYRLRRYDSNAFHIAPHGTKVEGDADTGVVPLANVWYRFKIQVEDTGSQTTISAKVWQQGKGEPADWQAYAVDTSSNRLITGTFGLWSYYTGSKYWDDLTVIPLGASPLQYALIVDTDEGGSVKSDPPGSTYNEGTEVQLIATAASGWEFTGWTGDITGTANPASVTMDADMYVAPTFTEIVVEIPKYSLTVVADGSGSVIFDPAGGIYEQGTQVMLTASSEPGWEFSGWSDDLSGSDNPATIVINGDRSITATFTEIMLHTLDVTTVGNGLISLDPDQAEYDLGQLVTMTATADPGWEFTGWSGDLSGISNPTTLTISGDHQVTATFADGTQTYAEDFEGYNDGDDPVNWLDTKAKNSMAENDSLFEVYDIGGEKVYGTNSTQANIHSHYVGGGSDSLTGYEYSGRMMITNSNGGIGVTFYSQYPYEDAYYRLRRYRSNAFHIAPHGTKVTGDTNTGVIPSPNVWYWFRIVVEDTGTRTEIRAKVWPENSAEPAAWQVDCYDSKSSRLTSGAIGVWSYLSGSKYWDELAVISLLP